MIYHRFGSVVKQITGFDEQSMNLMVIYEDSRDGKAEQVHITDLKADGGIHEIVKTAREQYPNED